MILAPMKSMKMAKWSVPVTRILNPNLICIVLHKNIFDVIGSSQVMVIQMEVIQENRKL